MVAIAATNSATPLDLSLVKSRLDAVRREADQAQANVRNLRAQTNAAESELEETQGEVRDLTRVANQTDPTYMSKLASRRSIAPTPSQELMSTIYSATTAKRQSNSYVITTSQLSAPTMNTQGQATGLFLNVSA
jgi:chromosome segregation ATPase